MGNKQVRAHYENAQKTGVLKISQQRLTEIPSSYMALPNVLRTLDISENRFEILPPVIGNFTLLKHLNLSGNRLTEIPDFIGKLIKLETLNVQDNLLTRLSPELSKLKNLKQALLSHNQLTTFPVQFTALRHLDVLDLSRNKITSVPDDVKDLNVTELNLNQNQLTSISENIADCKRLKTLRLEENCLQITAIHDRILRDSTISNLTIDGNLFNSKQFTALDGYDTYMERFTAVKKKIF